LGGANNTDINFPIGPDGMFLLLIAAAKGLDEMIHLMLEN
jgi:ankyrin repeat protein